MKSLIYGTNTSLDGYIEDTKGDFSWGVPTKSFFESVNAMQRPIGTYLNGRRLYETMAVWDKAHMTPDEPAFSPGLGPLEHEFANLWRAAEKVVFSRTLKTVSTANTRIEPVFDPAAIRKLKEQATSDL